MKKTLTSLILLAMLLTLVPLAIFASDQPDVWNGEIALDYASGNGTEFDPYIIKTNEQFAYFESQINSKNGLDSHYKLGADIVMNIGDASTWIETPPANTGLKSVGGEGGREFGGTFDGDGYTVSGLYLTKSGDDQVATVVGMFGCTKTGAVIKNFALVNSCIKTNNWSGGIVGETAGNTVVQNVYCDAYIYSEKDGGNGTIVGGIVGGSYGTATVTIENCVFAGSIISSNLTSKLLIGGIFGGTGNDSGLVTIKNCLNIGTVESTVGGKYIGGIVGQNNKGLIIENCINAVAPISSETDGVTDLCTTNPSAGRETNIINSYYVGTKSHQGTAVTATVENLILAELMGETALEGTSYVDSYTEWTKRVGDIIIPTGVSEFAPDSKFYSEEEPVDTTTIDQTETTIEQDNTTAVEDNETTVKDETTAIIAGSTTSNTTKAPADAGGCSSCSSSITATAFLVVAVIGAGAVFILPKKK